MHLSEDRAQASTWRTNQFIGFSTSSLCAFLPEHILLNQRTGAKCSLRAPYLLTDQLRTGNSEGETGDSLKAAEPTNAQRKEQHMQDTGIELSSHKAVGRQHSQLCLAAQNAASCYGYARSHHSQSAHHCCFTTHS